ncbi:MAG TPA: winged helix-turn-helix domain-containing protein [Mycobacteriales bacterium]
MTVDPDSFEPVYLQLARILRAQIAAGEYQPGAMLPSETTLAQAHGVGRDAVRQAIGVLRAEGIVYTVRRVGSFVRGAGEVTSVRVEGAATVTSRMPTAEERHTMGLDEGVPLLVVSQPGADEQVYPADRTALAFGG